MPRKLLVLLCLLAFLAAGVLAFKDKDYQPQKEDLIRFHVIANSDTPEDQALKMAVRDELLAKISADFAKVQTQEEARQLIKAKVGEIGQIAQREISRWGKDYKVEVVFGPAEFPTKTYGSFTLPAGEYEALKVIIGEGQGENWWCVLFPPLCFVDIAHSWAAEAPQVNEGEENQEKTEAEEVTEAFKLNKVEFRFKFLDLINRINPVKFSRYGSEDVI